MSSSAPVDPTRRLADALLRAVGVGRISVPVGLAGLIPLLRGAGAQAFEAAGDELCDAAIVELVWVGDRADAPALPEVPTLFIVAREASGGTVSRAAVEALAIRCGYRKHPATTALFGFEALGQSGSELWAVFERAVPAAATDDARLRAERDLHADMLREPGVRSDAHLVRYELAARLVRPNDVVLDAACGLGYGAHVIASLSEAGRVIGIDGSEWAIAYASQQYGGPRTEFRCGFLPAALDEMGDCSVDCVVSLETLEHVEYPSDLLRAFARVLRPGGRIFVSVPNDWADETGRDPNPHHLHVYDWARLNQELGQHFIVDGAWRLIASGCKVGDRRAWTPRARLLDAVSVDAAGAQDAEWWLASAVKSPVLTEASGYRQTVHGDFQGFTHLVDFERHYSNPWIVHSLVEIPWRVRDPAALRDLAIDLAHRAPRGSPDAAAALAVLGWRLADAGFTRAQLDAWLQKCRELRTSLGDGNPHAQRWRVSLAFLAARLQEIDGDVAEAVNFYEAVLATDVRSITPTLGTKSAEAAFRLGLLHWTAVRPAEARDAWRRGIHAASLCLHEDWIEFIGNTERPFPFALNDAIEMLDCAVRCSLALRVTSFGWPRAREGRELAELHSRSLRSAVNRLQADSAAAAADRRRVERALADVQQLAHQRAAELTSSVATLARTQAALEEVQRLAWQRADELQTLSVRLDRTQAALEEAQKLAIERAGRIEQVAVAVTELTGRLVQAQTAIEQAQSLALRRQTEVEALGTRLNKTQAALESTQQLAHARFGELQTVAARLERTQLALDQVQALAHQRHAEIEALSAQLTDAQQAVEQWRATALWRADELDRRAQAFGNKQAALETAQRLLDERERQLATRKLDVASLQSRLDALTARLQRAEGELLLERGAGERASVAERARVEAEHRGAQLASELAQLRVELQHQAEAARRLRSSFWWRLGAPVRWFAGALIANRTPPGPR